MKLSDDKAMAPGSQEKASLFQSLHHVVYMILGSPLSITATFYPSASLDSQIPKERE